MLTRAWRLRRYRRLLENSQWLVTDSETITHELRDFWRCLKPTDLLPISAEYRAWSQMAMYYPNLPVLVSTLQEQNKLIDNEEDGKLELRLAQQSRDKTVVSLDFYLADGEDLPIDEVYLLNRLRGLIQSHHSLVNRHIGHFYHRHSELLYKDLVTLTHVLIESTQERGQTMT